MTNFRAPAALVMVLGLCGWGVGPARGQERLVVSDKVERARVDLTDVDPDAGHEIQLDLPPRVTAGVVPSDCNAVGGFFVTFPGGNRYRGNVYRVTANARLTQIHMELSYDDPMNFVASVHRRNVDGSYSQVGQDIVVPHQTGRGAVNEPIFVDSVVIDPPIVLEAGFDYAIGFAWGAGNMVYARDSVAHPVNFEIGRVLGSVAVNALVGEPPAIPDTFGSLAIFTGGSYSMLLCLAPEPGACCDAALQECVDVLEPECVGAGSFFRGERTTCAETVCNFGACCGPCGTCENNVAEGACAADADATAWSGVSCPVTPSLLCPPVTGACCTTNGTCTQTCEALCVGTFQGVGTSCEPNICRGACCINNLGCSNRTPSSCQAFGGRFRGLGTNCDALPPELQCGGACCFGDSSLSGCAIVAQRELCDAGSFNFTLYRGDATTCPAQGNPCQPVNPADPVRACCLPDGSCINATEIACEATGVHGEFNASSTSCNNVVCSAPACCMPDGACAGLTTEGCTAAGGARPNPVVANCGLNTCPVGACCGGADGLCLLRTQAACVADGGSYRGNGTNCDVPAEVCLGIGSCCRPDGDCFDNETAAHCAVIGGGYQNDGSTCTAPTVDCDERGACCAATGTCLFVTLAECTQIDGFFRGAGVACAVNTCPAGACCLDETCERRTQVGCAADAGTYLGDATICTSGLCVPAACCNGNDCQLLTQTQCEDAQGSFAGQGVTCDVEGTTCLTGVCCEVPGEACLTIRAYECAAESGSFGGTGTICTLGACDVGACCRDSGCEVTSRANCEQSQGQNPGIFLGEASICTDSACVLGACCDGVTCTDEILTTCELAGRIYRGAGTSCFPDPEAVCPCNSGAQCDDNIECTVDTCNGTTQRCVHAPVHASCDNGILCDGAEVCEVGLGCQPGPPETCDDEVACTADTCNTETDECEHTVEPTACDDGQYCNGVETCTPEAVCQPGTARNCTAVGACVDALALAGLVECLSGPAVPAEASCACLNLSDVGITGVIDLLDFAAYQNRAVRP